MFLRSAGDDDIAAGFDEINKYQVDSVLFMLPFALPLLKARRASCMLTLQKYQSSMIHFVVAALPLTAG